MIEKLGLEQHEDPQNWQPELISNYLLYDRIVIEGAIYRFHKMNIASTPFITPDHDIFSYCHGSMKILVYRYIGD